MIDQEPSEEDIERFSASETGYCPECGTEIWDDITQCSSCGTWLEHGVSHRDSVSNDFRKKSYLIIVAIILIAFSYGLLRFF
ncbi:MAG: hypothetical protein QF718_08950 [Phycisphaerales bacterium]|jgi:uncharacterized membrane protein YvbJ|nr:hypothetical protein [Phycisphaerales bacterium]